MSQAASVPALEIECKQQADMASYDACAVVRHLSHELRQPLSTMESIAYYLRLIVSRQDEKTQGQLARLQLLVDQMDWILSDAVHFLQAAPRQPQIVDFYELLDSAAGERRLKGFRVERGEGPALIDLDPSQTRHLLSSLFRLARHLSKDAGEACATAWTSGGNVLLATHIPGFEIGPDRFAEMCEPFTPHLPSGSGLALASVCRIVESHGGMLRARVKPGVGTTILLSLPLA